MAAELILAPEAQQDAEQAYSWYTRIEGLVWEKNFLVAWTPVCNQFVAFPSFIQKFMKTTAGH